MSDFVCPTISPQVWRLVELFQQLTLTPNGPKSPHCYMAWSVCPSEGKNNINPILSLYFCKILVWRKYDFSHIMGMSWWLCGPCCTWVLNLFLPISLLGLFSCKIMQYSPRFQLKPENFFMRKFSRLQWLKASEDGICISHLTTCTQCELFRISKQRTLCISFFSAETVSKGRMFKD